MVAFSPSSHKAVVSTGSDPTGDISVDTRDMLARLLIDMGALSVVPGNTPPSARDSLWWHVDVKAFKRWDAVQGNWFPLTPNQLAMHLMRRAILGSVTEINVETGDLFCFWDVSVSEVKIITRDSLMNALGGTRTLTTQEGLKGGGDLSVNRTLSLDYPGMTAESVIADGDLLSFWDASAGAHRKVTIADFKTAMGIALPTTGYPVGTPIIAHVPHDGPNGVILAAGDTLPGSRLRLSRFYGTRNNSADDFLAHDFDPNSSLPGIWRYLGSTGDLPTFGGGLFALFVRVS